MEESDLEHAVAEGPRLEDRDGGDPVFICGYPKSGTTLLNGLFDGHRDLMVFPEETQFFRKVLLWPEKSPEQMITDLINKTEVKRLFPGTPVEGPGQERDLAGFDHRRFLGSLENLYLSSGRSRTELFDALMVAYAGTTNQLGKRFWVEKSPNNEAHLAVMRTLYPSSRAIYIVRDPRDNYCSQAIFRERVAQKYRDPKRRLTAWTFVSTWGNSVCDWVESEPNDRQLAVRYEDLLKDPEATLRRICDFLGIEFDATLLTPTKRGKLWSGNSMFGGSFSEIDPRPIGRWTERISRDDLAILERCLRPAMTALGYRLSGTPTPKMMLVASWLKRGSPRTQLAVVLLRLHRAFPGGLRVGPSSGDADQPG